MRIRRLKLSGFKSFVEPSELRIEPGLTGVVGPNGCGKSNLLEAIRWVMGEGSPKSLRGGGMDDVIFAGTASRPPRDFAEVSILVERDRDAEGSLGESEVTRRIERGAGSAYRIDGKDVRAKDVSLLFADAATGAHSPALVSQGKVGSIISAKPTDAGCCWRKRPAFPACTRDARTPSRSFARRKPTWHGLASCFRTRSSGRLSSGGRRAPQNATGNCRTRSGRPRRGWFHARWVEASGRNRGQARREDRRNRCGIAAGCDGQRSAGAGTCRGASWTTAQ